MDSEEATVFMVCMTVILITSDDYIRHLRSRLEEPGDEESSGRRYFKFHE